MSTSRERHQAATKLFHQQRFQEALDLDLELAKENYPPAFFSLGLTNEFRTDKEKDLEAARRYYLRAATMIRHPSLDIHLARINMKLGDWAKAGSYTKSALANRIYPDAWFLAGDFHSRMMDETSLKSLPTNEIRIASNYYFKASMRGRLLALKRYAQLQDLMKNRLRAKTAYLILKFSGPIARALRRRRAYYTY